MSISTPINVSNERAAYRVLNPMGFFVDDTLYTVDPKGDPAELYYDGEPNEGLEPINDLAKQRMNDFLEKLDNLARAAAEKTGRYYAGRPKTLDGAYEIVTEIQRQKMAVMGAKRETSSSERIDGNKIAETGLDAPNKRPGRRKE